MILQCPYDTVEITEMYDKIRSINNGSGAYALGNCENVLRLVLGGHIDGLTDEQKMNIWEISGSFVTKIYRKIIANRAGVG